MSIFNVIIKETIKTKVGHVTLKVYEINKELFEATLDDQKIYETYDHKTAVVFFYALKNLIQGKGEIKI